MIVKAGRSLLTAFVAFMLVALAAPAHATEPFSFDTAFGRLPKNVKPLDYSIAIVPNLTTHSFTGTETIALQVRSATPTIQFNTLNLTLANVRFDGTPVARTLTDNKAQLTTITLRSAANPGVHNLTLAYRGVIETSGPQGLFTQYYATREGKRGVALQTMFESTDARRMFPCWDEPAFRATFQLTATVAANLATVSNMPILTRTVRGSLATVTFARTPSMPAYLVEFSAANLASVNALHNGTRFAVWALRGRERQGAYALANAQQILDDYNAYFGVRFPLPALNSIALPGGFGGAMENWGAIVYNDQVLLTTPATSQFERQDIFAFQAHEMAHQWNGDLVTMGWWDDLWLNESFASWMAAKETDLRNPSWHWWEYQDGDKEQAMDADALPHSHPIAVHITNELQAETAFDSEITYAKGQAFLRMLEAYVGPDVFRAGVRRYIKARAFSNATAADLWNAVNAASRKDVARLAAPWIDKPGFPLVSVAATCATDGSRTIAFSQKRFLIEGSDPDATEWQIPLRIRAGITGPVQRVLVTGPGQTVRAGRCSEPLTVNDGAVGFYRVQYDSATLATNTAAFGTLPNPDRIALLDDQWALAIANQAPLDSFLTLARSMNGNLNPRAWTKILRTLAEIERDERDTPAYPAYVTFATGIVQPVLQRLGWTPKPGETADVRGLRRDIIAALGALGDPAVTAEAQRRFQRFLMDRRTLAPDDLETVLGIVAAGADTATFDRLHALALAAKDENEKRHYYDAMMSVSDDALAQRALALTLSKEIPPQAEQLRLRLLNTLAARHPALAWNALKANTAAYLDVLGPSGGPFVLAVYEPKTMWRAAPLEDIDAFIRARTPADLLPNLGRGMETARLERTAQTTLRAAIDAYLK